MEDNQRVANETAQRALEHRKYVLTEFIESEREYVRRLQIAVEDYYSHIRAEASENVSPNLKNDLLVIFSTLPEITSFHKNSFLPALEVCNWKEDPNAIMECFLKHRSEFSVYLPYCKNKPASDGARVEHDKFFASRQNELGHKLSIEDLLIAPVQRLPKYQLLIKDLLKDTQKAGLDSTKIEEALELMLKIPQETNNIICMSLIKGLSRGSIISHGSLWRQNSLVFSCTSAVWVSSQTSTCNIKNDPRHVFLFDHRILVALPADSEGFFKYDLCLRTLNGRVSEENESPNVFSFSTEDNTTCYFKANTAKMKKEWMADITSILNSQEQMKKALVFGKPATNSVAVRMNSLSVEWSDSDSSVDSMPSSADEREAVAEEEEDDWPKHTGFQRIMKKQPFSVDSLTIPPIITTTSASNMNRSVSLTPYTSAKVEAAALGKKVKKKKRKEESSMATHSLRPLSCDFDSVSAFDQNMQRKSHALSISPRMLRRWVARKCNSQASGGARIYFPTTTTPSFDLIRSPGSCSKSQHGKPPSHQEVLFITIPDPPAVAPQLYTPQPGQVFVAEDVSQVEVWKMRALSGDISGMSVWVQRNCLEEYSAPISLNLWKKEYHILNSLSVGRFSKVKQVKSKQTKEVNALKILQSHTSEEQFYRELCIGSRLKHRNLLQYYMGLQQSNVMAIAMEFINGRLLLDYMVHKVSMTESKVVGLMRQLLDGLEYLHGHSVYHLDIRPENIMMDLAKDCLKIIDYGAARHSGDVDEVLSRNFETCYNYEYVAPEIFQQVHVGPGTDIWGVGLIIYLIFFGCTPFYGESTVRIIANITSLHYSFPELDTPTCSKHALQLVKDILVLAPSQRPSAKAVKEHPWFSEDTDSTGHRVYLNKLRKFIFQH